MMFTGNEGEFAQSTDLLMKTHVQTQSGYIVRIILRIALVVLCYVLNNSLSAENGFISNIIITDDVSPYSDYPYDSVTKAIYTTSDDGVVVIAQTSWEMDEMNYIDAVTVVRLDSYGTLLWQHTIGGEYPLYSAYTVTAVGIDAIDTVSLIAAYDEQYLFEIDNSGSITYTQLAIEYPSYYNLNKALRTDTGDIIAVGYGRPDGNSQNYPIYCRFSADGETLAQAFFAPDSTFTTADAYDAVVDNNGNVLVGCKLNQGYLDLLKLDLDGNLISRTTLPGSVSNTYYLMGVHLSHNPGADHALAVYCRRDSSPYPDNLTTNIVRITETEMICQTFTGSEVYGCESILEIGNDVIVAGKDYESNNTGSLFRFNYSQGYELEWVWNDPQFDGRFTYASTSDLLSRGSNDCIFAVGSGLGPYLPVAKVLPNGQVPIEDNVQTPTLNVLSAYPNPMRGTLNIDIKSEIESHSEPSQIGIYNTRGQLVRKFQSIKGNPITMWDGVDEKGAMCPSGVYIIQGTTGNVKPIRIVKF